MISFPHAIRHSRNGLTALEMLVVLSVVGLLMAILVPAIQHARETSRRTQCTTNLRQIASAAHGFEAIHGEFPNHLYHFRDVLPHLDQVPLYEYLKKRKHSFNKRTGSVPVLICPTDAHADVARNQTSYRISVGSTIDPWKFDGMVGPGPEGVRIQEVHDGLSNTAMYSERLVQPDVRGLTPATFDRFSRRYEIRFLWRPPLNYDGTILRKLAADCQAPINRITAAITRTDRDYAFQLHGGEYTHLSGPNTFSCFKIGTIGMNGGLMAGANGASSASISSTSAHAGGVNTAMADGSVRFISDSIHLETWRALGTRAGGDELGTF